MIKVSFYDYLGAQITDIQKITINNTSAGITYDIDEEQGNLKPFLLYEEITYETNNTNQYVENDVMIVKRKTAIATHTITDVALLKIEAVETSTKTWTEIVLQ